MGWGSLAAIVAIVSLTRAAGAQARTADSVSAAFGTVAGFVFDSTTGEPVGRAMVCSSPRRAPNAGGTQCANTDYNGRYRLDSLPAGRYFLFAMCQYGSRRPSVALGARSLTDSVPVRTGAVTESVIFAVRDSACSDPERRRPRFIRGVFRGRYAGGTDYRGEPQSVFTPCPGDDWPTKGDSAPLLTSAWLTWSPLLLKFGGLSVLRTEARGIEGQLFYFARVRGVLIGPRPAGTYRSYPYELVVDSILEARTPGQRDCM